jgi:two-component system cell cycle response regulator DivK
MGSRILVVEDNEDSRIMLVKALKRLGHETIEAESGEEAVEKARSERPDLILMDVELKGMDGLTATGRIKADPALRSIPVVALTAYAMAGDRERALRAGCDGYLAKPVDVRSLDAEVAQYLVSKSKGGR